MTVRTDSAKPALNLPESFETFLETSREGYVYTDPGGQIIYANKQFAEWLQQELPAVLGTKLRDHLPIARKVYFETHLAPLLRMQGYFGEAAMDLARADGTAIPVIISGVESADATGKTEYVRYTIFPARDRRQYERTLVAAKAAAAADNTKLRDMNISLGDQIADYTRQRLQTEGELLTERETAALREQFIAVLGHDLRNPLAAIQGAMRIIAKTPINDRALSVIGMVHQSVNRMASLIDDVMDFARGRLGSGMIISTKRIDLHPVLVHVVNELRTSFPDRPIVEEFEIQNAVLCDAPRIGQLLSNLLANALTHGATDSPVRVTASQTDKLFKLSVANSGQPISDDAMERLFQPFTRADVQSGQGLGLGLYIAAEIARAHGGTLRAHSGSGETCFIFEMPLTLT